MSDYKGSCLCGAITFKARGEIGVFMLCHCKHCQKDTGSAHGANVFLNNGELNWINGSEKVKCFNLPETRHTKCFCMQCGSAMPYLFEDCMVVLPAGSLDVPLDIEPTAHIFCKSRAQWEKYLTKTVKFDELPQ